MSTRSFARQAVLVRNNDGSALLVENALVSFFLHGTNTPIPIFATSSGGAPLAQPIRSGPTAEVMFWADFGDTQQFDALISSDGTTVRAGTARPVSFSPFTEALPAPAIPNANAASALATTSVKSAPYTAQATELVPVDASAGSVPITLQAAPPDRSWIAVKLIAKAGTNQATVACGGSDVFNRAGGATTLTLSMLAQGVLLLYSASAGVWSVMSDDLPLAQLDARHGDSVPYLADDFERPDGAPGTASTGQVWATAGSGTPAIRSGRFACTANGFGYLGTTLAAPPTRLGMRVVCIPGTIPGSGATIASSSHPDGVSGITGTINNCVHAYLSRLGVTIQKRITTTGGSFVVHLANVAATVIPQTTIPITIPWGSSVAAVQALVDATGLVGLVTVGGSVGAYSFSYGGALADTAVALASVDFSGLTSVSGSRSGGAVYPANTVIGDGSHNAVQTVTAQATVNLLQVGMAPLDWSVEHDFVVEYDADIVSVSVDGRVIAAYRDADFVWLAGTSAFFEAAKNTSGAAPPNDFDEFQISDIWGDGPAPAAPLGRSLGSPARRLGAWLADHQAVNPTTPLQGSGLVANRGQAHEVWIDQVGAQAAIRFGGDATLQRLGAALLGVSVSTFFEVGAAWNQGHFLMGGYHLWVDGTGALRMKASAPVNDLDGSTILAADPAVVMPWQYLIDVFAPAVGGANFGANAAFATFDGGPFGGYIDNLNANPGSPTASSRSWDQTFSGGGGATYALWVWADQGPAGAKFDVSIAGITVATYDTYAAAPQTGALFQTFGITTPFTATNKKRVIVTLNGRNVANSTGWQTRIRRIQLVRTA